MTWLSAAAWREQNATLRIGNRLCLSYEFDSQSTFELFSLTAGIILFFYRSLLLAVACGDENPTVECEPIRATLGTEKEI